MEAELKAQGKNSCEAFMAVTLKSHTNGKAAAKFSGRRVQNYRRPYGRWWFHPALRDGRFTRWDVPAMLQDNAVSIGLYTIYGPMFGAEFEVKANSKDIKTFVDNTIYRFWHHDLMRVLQHYITSGTAVAEVLYEIDQDTGLWRYAGMDDFDMNDVQALRRGRQLTGARVSYGSMAFTGAYTQSPAIAGSTSDGYAKEWNVIRHPKIFWCAQRPQCGELFGRSSLEPSWNPWMEKVGAHGAISIRKLWAFANAFRGCVVKFPPGGTFRRADGVEVDNQDIARELAENYCTGAGLFCPSGSDEHGKPLWEIIDPQINGDVRGLMDYPAALDRAIWQGMGVLDEVIHAPDTGGSWSGRSGPLLVFLNIADMRVREIMTAFDVGPSGYTTRNDESGGVIRSLVMENFGPNARYQIVPVSLVPKPAEPGAGGAPGSAPDAAMGGPPQEQPPPPAPMPPMDQSPMPAQPMPMPMGSMPPAQQMMGGQSPQPIGARPMQLSAALTTVEIPGSSIDALIEESVQLSAEGTRQASLGYHSAGEAHHKAADAYEAASKAHAIDHVGLSSLFDEIEHPRDHVGRWTFKPIKAEHVSNAKRAMAAGKLKIQHAEEPIVSDASGAPIKNFVALQGGEAVHPDELHRLNVEDGDTILRHDEGLTIYEPSGVSDSKSFSDALHRVAAYSQRPDDAVRIVSRHGYSANRPRLEWIEQHESHDPKQSFSEWYDAEGHKHTSRQVDGGQSGAVLASEDDTADFFAAHGDGGGRLAFDAKPEDAKTQRIMGKEMSLAESQEIDGVLFDRFETANGGAIRVIDKDSGHVLHRESEVKKLTKAAVGTRAMTQARAKAGGEIGPNGEPYPGGAFIATTEMPKRMKRKLEKAATGSVNWEPGQKWAVPEPGKMAICDKLMGTVLNHRDIDDINYDYMEHNNQPPEYVQMVKEIAAKWKDGERWIDVKDYPSLANFTDIARLVVAGKAIPGDIMGQLDDETKQAFAKYKGPGDIALTVGMSGLWDSLKHPRGQPHNKGQFSRHAPASISSTIDDDARMSIGEETEDHDNFNRGFLHAIAGIPSEGRSDEHYILGNAIGKARMSEQPILDEAVGVIEQANNVAEHVEKAWFSKELLSAFKKPADWLRNATSAIKNKIVEKYGAKNASAIFAAGQMVAFGLAIGKPRGEGSHDEAMIHGGGLLTSLALAGMVDAYRKLAMPHVAPMAMSANGTEDDDHDDLSSEMVQKIGREVAKTIVDGLRHQLGGSRIEMSAARAPKGYTHEKPLVIQGNPYVGGQYIPPGVMARATPAEKAAVNEVPSRGRQSRHLPWTDTGSDIVRTHGGFNLTRAQMPNIPGKSVLDFLSRLKKRGITVYDKSISVGLLRPTQGEMSKSQMNQMITMPEAKLRSHVLVSSDGFILDGHHRWGHLLTRSPESKINAYVIGLPIKSLISEANRYSGAVHRNIKDIGVGKTADNLGPQSSSRVDPKQEEAYVSQATGNLAKTSRTAGGTVDTSASAGKAEKMANVIGEQAAQLTKNNFKDVIHQLYRQRGEDFSSPERVLSLCDSVNREINHGITKEGALLRTDDPDEFPYTKVSDLSLARKQFSEEFAKRLSDPHADPIETAAWVEWRVNIDHAYADGCGRTQRALAAIPLMRANLPLPNYDDPKKTFGYFPKTPIDPKQGGKAYTERDDYKKFLKYYRMKNPAWGSREVRRIEKTHFPPANPIGVDALSRHQKPDGTFTPQRAALHQSIAHEIRSHVKPSQDKTYFMMGGGPASGKSSVIRAGLVKLPESHVFLDSDKIKARLPEMKILIDAGDGRAADYVHEESSAIAKALQADSFRDAQNVVLDGTGDNSFDSMMKKVNDARAAGYKVNASYTTCSVDEAVRRNIIRAFGGEKARGMGYTVHEHEMSQKPEGRLPPEDMLREVHRGVSIVLPQLTKHGAFDNVQLWDTEHKTPHTEQERRGLIAKIDSEKDEKKRESLQQLLQQGKPTLVMSAQGTNQTVHHPELWQKFLSKGK